MNVLDIFSGIGAFSLALGNSLVPQIPELIGRAILERETSCEGLEA